jgi:hypothetical protein
MAQETMQLDNCVLLAVPYAISVLYTYRKQQKNDKTFDLQSYGIRKSRDDLVVYLKLLMILINDLIKKYAKSDDLGEYTEERIRTIFQLKEIAEFLQSNNSCYKYLISIQYPKELEKKLKSKSKVKEVDFKLLNDYINIHSKKQRNFIRK